MLVVSKYVRVSAAMLALATITIGCGGGSNQGGQTTARRAKVPIEATLNVPAEQGGPGFKGEGWQSNENYEPTTDPRGVVGGQFSMALYEFPATLRTQGKDSNTEFMNLVEGMVYESLIGTHPLTLEFVPNLATHWKISEDKQTFWYRINPNARFADGGLITTEDVISTWKLLVDPGILAPYSNFLWGKFDEPVAESPYIVRVHSKELNWKFFLYFGGMSILPAKYLKQVDGTKYLEEYQFKMMPGSGLYELDTSSLVNGQSLMLQRRSDYWDIDNPKAKGGSNFEQIKYTVVRDERLNFEKFKKGEFDMYIVGRAQWWKQECDFDNVKRGLIQKRKVYTDNPQGISGLVFNMRKPPFNDIRMRQAFTYMLNREKLIKELFYNEYLMIDSYYPGSMYENPNNPKYRYDPDKAVALLTECGYSKRNNEGWLVNGKGEMLSFELSYDQPSFERILTVYQEDLKKVGIKLDLKQATAATMFKMVSEHKFLIHWQSWGGLLFPNPENDVSSWTADPENTANLAGVKDPRIDELIKEYNVCFDQSRRIAIIQEIDGIMMKMQPFALGWYGPYNRILYWNKLGHPEFYFSRTGDWRSVIGYWWIDPAKEKKLEKARNNTSDTLDVGDTDVMYWPEYDKTHGKSFQIKGL